MLEITSVWLILGFGAMFLGCVWIAMSMQAHWAQVYTTRRYSGPPGKSLRIAGGLSLFLSLGLCLIADHPTMAALVWVMFLTASSLLVAMILAWRPRSLVALWPTKLR